MEIQEPVDLQPAFDNVNKMDTCTDDKLLIEDSKKKVYDADKVRTTDSELELFVNSVAYLSLSGLPNKLIDPVRESIALDDEDGIYLELSESPSSVDSGYVGSLTGPPVHTEYGERPESPSALKSEHTVSKPHNYTNEQTTKPAKRKKKSGKSKNRTKSSTLPLPAVTHDDTPNYAEEMYAALDNIEESLVPECLTACFLDEKNHKLPNKLYICMKQESNKKTVEEFLNNFLHEYVLRNVHEICVGNITGDDTHVVKPGSQLYIEKINERTDEPRFMTIGGFVQDQNNNTYAITCMHGLFALGLPIDKTQPCQTYKITDRMFRFYMKVNDEFVKLGSEAVGLIGIYKTTDDAVGKSVDCLLVKITNMRDLPYRLHSENCRVYGKVDVHEEDVMKRGATTNDTYGAIIASVKFTMWWHKKINRVLLIRAKKTKRERPICFFNDQAKALGDREPQDSFSEPGDSGSLIIQRTILDEPNPPPNIYRHVRGIHTGKFDCSQLSILLKKYLNDPPERSKVTWATEYQDTKEAFEDEFDIKLDHFTTDQDILHRDVNPQFDTHEYDALSEIRKEAATASSAEQFETTTTATATIET